MNPIIIKLLLSVMCFCGDKLGMTVSFKLDDNNKITKINFKQIR